MIRHSKENEALVVLGYLEIPGYQLDGPRLPRLYLQLRYLLDLGLDVPQSVGADALENGAHEEGLEDGNQEEGSDAARIPDGTSYVALAQIEQLLKKVGSSEGIACKLVLAGEDTII